MTPDESIVLDRYLDLTPDVSGGQIRKSSFAAAVEEARSTSGRDSNGFVVACRQSDAGRWIGAIAWLCLLDQLGHTITLTSSVPRGDRAVERFKGCLGDFATGLVGQDEPALLWSLRNSLAHDFCLYGGGQQFALNSYKPLKENLTKRKGSIVTVNLWALGNVANQIVMNVISAHAKGDVVLRLTPEDMKRGYFMIYRDPDFVPESVSFATLSSASASVTGITRYESSVGSPSASAFGPMPMVQLARTSFLTDRRVSCRPASGDAGT